MRNYLNKIKDDTNTMIQLLFKLFFKTFENSFYLFLNNNLFLFGTLKTLFHSSKPSSLLNVHNIFDSLNRNIFLTTVTFLNSFFILLAYPNVKTSTRDQNNNKKVDMSILFLHFSGSIAWNTSAKSKEKKNVWNNILTSIIL